MASVLAWDNFYVIVGSSAGALTGLTFVVITLGAGRLDRDAMNRGISSFSTPTIVHFGAVILVSAILSAPWPSLWQAAFLLGLCGLGGLAYGVIVVRRLRHQMSYQPVREDWLWYAVVPLVAYTALLGTAIVLPRSPAPALFGIGAAIVLLLFTGIHNAWDAVTFIAVERFVQQDERNDENAKQE
jgi:hypothetical protein